MHRGVAVEPGLNAEHAVAQFVRQPAETRKSRVFQFRGGRKAGRFRRTCEEFKHRKSECRKYRLATRRQTGRSEN